MSATEILRRDRALERKRAEARERKRERREQRIAELREQWAKTGPDELLDEIGACLYVGGSRPIDSATLWRQYSKPIKVSAQAVRWTRQQLEADRARMNAERDSKTGDRAATAA
jgi:hypothetical protein